MMTAENKLKWKEASVLLGAHFFLAKIIREVNNAAFYKSRSNIFKSGQ